MRTLLTAGGVALAGTMLGALAYATVTNVGSSPAAATSNGSQSTDADASAACAAPAKIVDGVCETVVHTTAGGGTSGSNSARGAVAEPTPSSERGESEVRRDDDSSRESGHEDADAEPEGEPEDD